MKIGIVHDYQPNLGGTTEIIIRMARALRKKGHDCTLITRPESWIRNLDRKNIELLKAEKVSITFMKYIPFTFTKVEKIISAYRKKRIELCHAHYALPYGITTYLAKQIYSIPYILTLHGTDVHRLASLPSLKPVMKLCIENADAVTAVCNYLRKKTLRKLDTTKEIHVIPNFVNTDRFKIKSGCETLKKEFKIPHKNFIISHVSNYSSSKNVILIPQIAEIVVEQNPDVNFLMVGEPLDGETHYYEALKEEVKVRGLENNFRFAGRRKDIAKIYNISDISLLTSIKEGMPLVVLESLAVGVPVISSGVGGVPEVIENGKTGYLVNDFSPESFAKKILMISEKDDKIKMMGRNGIELIKKQYSEEKIISQYIKLYEKVV